MFGTPFGSGTFWGARDVRRRVASAKFVLCPVNTAQLGAKPSGTHLKYIPSTHEKSQIPILRILSE